MRGVTADRARMNGDGTKAPRTTIVDAIVIWAVVFMVSSEASALVTRLRT